MSPTEHRERLCVFGSGTPDAQAAKSRLLYST